MQNEVTGLTAAESKRQRRNRLFRRFRRGWAITGASLWVVFLVFQFFANRASGPAPQAMRSDSRVRVTLLSDHWRFEPADREIRNVGLIFFPGSLVDPVAYAPLARTVAAEGFRACIIPLPLRLAPLKKQKEAVARTAADLITHARGTRTGRWVVAGHSLGAVFAARFARDYPDLTDGLVLVGTSHPRDFDLSHLTVPVTKIYGTRDGLAVPAEVKKNAAKLPETTHWVEVAGGNHAQFGWYGVQIGDQRATIPHADQQRLLAQAVLKALNRTAARPSPAENFAGEGREP